MKQVRNKLSFFIVLALEFTRKIELLFRQKYFGATMRLSNQGSKKCFKKSRECLLQLTSILLHFEFTVTVFCRRVFKNWLNSTLKLTWVGNHSLCHKKYLKNVLAGDFNGDGIDDLVCPWKGYEKVFF